MQVELSNDKGGDIDTEITVSDDKIALAVTFQEERNGEMGTDEMAQLVVAVDGDTIEVSLARLPEFEPVGPDPTIVVQFKRAATGWQIQEF